MNRAYEGGAFGVMPAGAMDMASSMEDTSPLERGKEWSEHLAVLRRHWLQIVLVAAVLAMCTTVVALALPKMYRSSATILIQEQEVPPEMVRSTITSYADERIQVISQQVMTRAVLLRLIEAHDLYPRLRQRATSDELVERMRKDIKLTPIDSSISDRVSGRRVNATIAFQISYDSQKPDAAQKVVSELVTLYLNENVKARQQSVTEIAAFLSQESTRAADRIREIESNLAAFKRRHAGRTPESSMVNMQLAERTDVELMRVEREISLIQDRQATLKAQLALVEPHLPAPAAATGTPAAHEPTPADRLRELKDRFATMSAVYGRNHPDLRKLQREIDLLATQVGAPVPEGGGAARRDELAADLAKLRERYAENHPDVQKLRRSIAALNLPGGVEPYVAQAMDRQAARHAVPPSSPTTPAPARRPDNPAYVALQTQIAGAKREIDQLSALRDDLKAKQRAYDTRLAQMPEIEREYNELTRDYENAQARYREVRAKEMQAQVAQELERDRKAERFTLGEPPNLPQAPVGSKRLQVGLLGAMGSIAVAIGLAFVRDGLDRSIKGPLELGRIARIPLLTAIPYIETRAEASRRRLLAAAGSGITIVLVASVVYALHLFWKPLPSVVESLVNRLPF